MNHNNAVSNTDSAVSTAEEALAVGNLALHVHGRLLNKDVKIALDSGSNVSLVNEIFIEPGAEIAKSDTILISANKSMLNVKGKSTIFLNLYSFVLS